VLLPPLAILMASAVGLNLYHPRYFGFTTPAFALALALGLDRLPHRLWKRIVAIVLLLAALPVQLSQRDVTSKAGYDWVRAADAVGSEVRIGDGVYFSPAPHTRTIAIAYPLAFIGTTDITLAVSPAEHGSLAGLADPLDGAVLQDAPARIWGLWSVRSAGQAADLDQFAAAGYHEAHRWTGTETTVALLER
jgi:mannosyltransferase